MALLLLLSLALLADASRFYATTTPGLEKVLAAEVRALNYCGDITDVRTERMGVSFRAGHQSGYHLLYGLRSSLRLMEVLLDSEDGGRSVRNRVDLYAFLDTYDWTSTMAPHHTFKCDTTLGDTADTEAGGGDLSHSHYSSLTLKNVVVDQHRARHGNRPSVDVADPDVFFSMYLHGGRCVVYRVWSGAQSMHKRGYRADVIHKASLRETVAAGLLLSCLSDWAQPAAPPAETDYASMTVERLKQVLRERALPVSGAKAVLVERLHASFPAPASAPLLLDPMCGSGTLLLEAALIHANTAPGLLRHGSAPPSAVNFADIKGNIDMHVTAVQRAREMDRRALLSKERRGEAVFVGSDISGSALQLAEHSARLAGVAGLVKFERCDALQAGRERPRCIVTNPPWDLRLTENTDDAWRKLGVLARALQSPMHVLTGNPDVLRHLAPALTPVAQLRLQYGAVDARFVKFQRAP